VLNLLPFFLYIWGGEGRALPFRWVKRDTREKAGARARREVTHDTTSIGDMREKARSMSGMRARGHNIIKDGGPAAPEGAKIRYR